MGALRESAALYLPQQLGPITELRARLFGATVEARLSRAADEARLFGAVVADGFDGAAGEGFFAESAFFLGFWLFIEVGMATVLIAFEVRGCGLPAEVTVDALVIDVVGSWDVLGVAVVFVGHGGRWMDEWWGK